VRKANAKKPSESLPLQGISKNSKNSQISNNKTDKSDGKRMIVSPRKGLPKREITSEKVRSVMYLQQNLAAQRLGISVTVLKRACRNFQLGPWPRKFPETFLSAPVVKQIEAQQMTFAEELMRSSVQKQTPESLSGGM
jgi:predicted secreted hydrolase